MVYTSAVRRRAARTLLNIRNLPFVNGPYGLRARRSYNTKLRRRLDLEIFYGCGLNGTIPEWNLKLQEFGICFNVFAIGWSYLMRIAARLHIEAVVIEIQRLDDSTPRQHVHGNLTV